MPAAAARALKPIATRRPLMATTAVQALWRIAKTTPDQFIKEVLNIAIPDRRTGAVGCGISAACWVRSAILILDAGRQEFGVHFKKMAATGGRVSTRELEWP